MASEARCFKVIRWENNWTAAIEACQSSARGHIGFLASLDTNEALKTVKRLTGTDKKRSFWIGGYDTTGNLNYGLCNWKWMQTSDGAPLGQIGSKPYEIDFKIHSGPCVALTDRDTVFKGVNCSWELDAICEFSARDEPVYRGTTQSEDFTLYVLFYKHSCFIGSFCRG